MGTVDRALYRTLGGVALLLTSVQRPLFRADEEWRRMATTRAPCLTHPAHGCRNVPSTRPVGASLSSPTLLGHGRA